MKIGVVGSGKLGATIARLLAAGGHVVALSNTRGPNSLEGVFSELRGQARAGTTSEVAIGADVVILALPFGGYGALPVEPFRRKIVVDATNYDPRRDGHFAALDADRITSSELIAEHLNGARVVKAFNTMRYETLAGGADTAAREAERLTVFLAGDDIPAKTVVAGLIDQLGFTPMDTGSLAHGGRLQQPGSRIYDVNIRGADAARATAAAQAPATASA